MNDVCIVIKVPGRTVWNGRWSDRVYARAQTLVYRIIRETERMGSFRQFIVEPMVEWENRKAVEK